MCSNGVLNDQHYTCGIWWFGDGAFNQGVNDVPVQNMEGTYFHQMMS